MLAIINGEDNSIIGKKIDLDFFEKFYVDFLLNLREGHSLPQNIIHSITLGFKSLIELIHELLKVKSKSSLIQYHNSITISATNSSILLNDVNEVIANVI